MDADDEVVLTRVVPRDGRCRATCDGRLATASELAARGVELLDLHGQHAYQALLATAGAAPDPRQLRRRAGREPHLAAYRAVREEFASIDAELERARWRRADAATRDRAARVPGRPRSTPPGLADPDEDSRLDERGAAPRRRRRASRRRCAARTARVDAEVVRLTLGAAIAALGGRPTLRAARAAPAGSAGRGHGCSRTICSPSTTRWSTIRSGSTRSGCGASSSAISAASTAPTSPRSSRSAPRPLSRLDALRGHDERVAELEAAARAQRRPGSTGAAGAFARVRTAAAEPFATAP